MKNLNIKSKTKIQKNREVSIANKQINIFKKCLLFNFNNFTETLQKRNLFTPQKITKRNTKDLK